MKRKECVATYKYGKLIRTVRTYGKSFLAVYVRKFSLKAPQKCDSV